MRRLVCLIGFGLLAALPLRAASLEEDVRAADASRVLATIAGNVTRLEPLLSNALLYMHADGRVQSKAEFLNAVKTAQIKYESYNYADVKVTRVTDDVAYMSGRARLRATAGTLHVEFTLSFLSVWRREDGAWRMVAYQSAKLSEPAVVAPGK